MDKARTRILVIGSGAGGAVTTLELAKAGYEVLVLEEGSHHDISEYGKSGTVAIPKLYRKRGMTPIMGRVPIGYAEGQCVGGGTEINSGFWQQAPRETLLRWKSQYDLCDASEEDLLPHYRWAEEILEVAPHPVVWSSGTQVFARGIEAMGWTYKEIPRAAPGCKNTNTCPHGCPTGAKQGMSRRMIPLAERYGAKVVSDCRALLLLKKAKRITEVIARLKDAGDAEHLIRFQADHVFLCCGPTETPALLQRSGIGYHIGNTLKIHPYLKVAAKFHELIDAQNSVMPLLQVKEFSPQLTFGGSFFTPGQLALTLSENWPQNMEEMKNYRHMAQFYIGVQGEGKGSVKPTLLGQDGTIIRYELTPSDITNLSIGLARLSSLLLAAGAESVHPSVYGIPSIRTEKEAARWLEEPLSRSRLSLMTVHAFSSCPIGERNERCAGNSFGKIHGFENLYINDASMLPDSPGVNPQATIMAMARRNVLAFLNKQ